MQRLRVRIRFRKQGDLRLIGHRDLVRTLERLFRRAGLPLRRSEGFHPKAKMSFPSALALGIEGTDEVMEIELTRPIDSSALVEQLNRQAPSGLTIQSAQWLPDAAHKARAAVVGYEIRIPVDRRPALQEAIDRLLALPTVPLQRPGRPAPIDLLGDLKELGLVDGVLRMALRVSGAASASPRDLLAELGVADLEQQGNWLTRTAVELAP
jgi:radical SAM-linked protein